MTYDWTVIGAGPAGIAAIAKLIDHGVQTNKIAWIDPKFQVGDLGTLWFNVPSNTKVKLFHKFLHSSAAFDYANCPIDFEINHLESEKTCYLRSIVEPLQWISNHLLKSVNKIEDIAESIFMRENKWHILFKKHNTINSKNVILAIGAEPKALSLASLPIISLHDALDKNRLANHLEKEDVVAVFGSSHSAILALKNLVEDNVSRIVNFYRTPIRYAVPLDKWILFDDSGLKGLTADWARKYIDGVLPKNLIRIFSNEENIEHYLPQCSKVIYAIGFERRVLPIVEGIGHLNYIKQCGIIAPGLFGLGIAFPEAKYNKIGILEYRVGLWKFIEYLHDMLPIWLKYSA